MKLISRPVIKLTTEEKMTLRKAAEIVKEIVDALENNNDQGFSLFQEGLDAPEAFWELKVNFKRIENEDLIP